MIQKIGFVRKFVLIIFDGVLLVGAFAIAQMFVVLPWSVRSAFSRLVMKAVEITLENNTILNLAVNVRWRK